jgi:hypothetical protein
MADANGGSGDRPSPVFALLDRLEVDVDVGGLLRWSDGTDEVVRIDHRAHDGMSAAATLLTQAGYEIRPPRRSATVSGDVRLRDWPGIWKRFRTDFRDGDVPWVEERPFEGRLPPLATDDPSFGWITWDRTRSEAILAACDARRVSVNALMLWGLQRAVRPLVEPGATTFPWNMPVDLRRRGRADGSAAVATSGVLLRLGEDDTPEDVQAQIVRKVEERTYLAYWWITERLPRLLPQSVLWPVLRKKEQGANRCMGGCTFLGDLSAWVVRAPADRQIRSIVPFNLLSRQFPVQSVGVQWEGQLSFSLRIHPCMWAGDVAPLVESWRQTIEVEAGLSDSTQPRSSP